MSNGKGIPRGAQDMLNLPHLEDILKERDDYDDEDDVDESVADEPLSLPADFAEDFDVLTDLEDKLRSLEGEDHQKALDALYEEMLDHARSIMDLSFNTDERSRRGLMEIAAAMYKNVMDAKNSKRDAQLKLMTLIQSQRRLEFEKLKWQTSLTGKDGEPVAVPGEITATATVVPQDRNELIKQMIAARKPVVEEAEEPEEPDDQ